MRRSLSAVLVVFAICGEGGQAFTPTRRECRTTKLYSNTSNDSSRRNFLTTAATTVIATASTLIVSPNPSAQNPMQSTPFSGSNGTTTEFELIGYISNDKPSGKSALILIYHFIACVC